MSSNVKNPALQDLIFELSDSGQTKICIAVCDHLDERREVIRHVFAELEKAGVRAGKVELSATRLDLVAKLQDYLQNHKTDVILVDGLESLPEEAVRNLFARLNFRRDVLAGLNVAVVLWVSNDLLLQLISFAPDFWSRRTATYFLNRVEIETFMRGLFGRESGGNPQSHVNRRISRSLNKVLSHEAELNKLLEASKSVSPIQIDKHTRAISLGLDSLIRDAKEGKAFLIAMNLWNLADVESYLRNYTRAWPMSRYDLHTGALLDIVRRLTNILENYRKNLLDRAKERQVVSLLSYFGKSAINSVKRLSEKVIKNKRREFSFSDLDLDVNVMPSSHAPQMELADWLEGGTVLLPGIFTRADESLLRILYNESRNVATVAKKLRIPRAQAKRKIEELRDKVSFFLGMA